MGLFEVINGCWGTSDTKSLRTTGFLWVAPSSLATAAFELMEICLFAAVYACLLGCVCVCLVWLSVQLHITWLPQAHTYTHSPRSYHICQCLFLQVNLFAWVCVCMCVCKAKMCVCVYVCKDLPEDSSHAPLISTATCWLSRGSGKINPTSLKDPRKGFVIPALITTLITIVVWMLLHFCLHSAARVCLDACVCMRVVPSDTFSQLEVPRWALENIEKKKPNWLCFRWESHQIGKCNHNKVAAKLFFVFLFFAWEK